MIVYAWWVLAWGVVGLRAGLAEYSRAVYAAPPGLEVERPADDPLQARPRSGGQVIYLERRQARRAR